MLHPVWDAAKEQYVAKVSDIPWKSQLYPAQKMGEGGIFKDFISSSDLEQVVKDLNINVPDAKLQGRYDDEPLPLRNKLYAPFIETVAGIGYESEEAYTKDKIANAYSQMTSKDLRNYDAVMKRLQQFRKLGINHQSLTEAADYFTFRKMKFEEQLKWKNKQIQVAQKHIHEVPTGGD